MVTEVSPPHALNQRSPAEGKGKGRVGQNLKKIANDC